MKFINFIIPFILIISTSITAADTSFIFMEKTNQINGSPTTSPHGSPTKKENTAYGAKCRRSPIKKQGQTHDAHKEACRNRLFEDTDRETLVLFVTAPHDQPDRGDTDYVQSVMKSLQSTETKVKTIYVKNDCNLNDKNLYDIDELYDSKKHKKPVYQVQDDDKRKQAVCNIVNYIQSVQTSQTILHLQLRAPETGCLFFDSDLDTLKSNVNKLVITCHEWCHGTDNLRDQQMKFFKKANHVVFLNREDQQNAIKYLANQNTCSTSASTALQPSFDLAACSSYSNITQTVPTSIKVKNANTPPNILVFGLIRDNKGFKEAVLLAKAIKDLDQEHPLHDARVKIAGKPNDKDLLIHMISATYDLDDDQNFKQNINKNFNDGTSRQKCSKFLAELQGKPELISPEKLIELTKKLEEKQTIKGYGTSPYKKAFTTANAYNPSPQELEKIHIQAVLTWLDENQMKPKVLPIDFHFDIDTQQLDELAQECKYCLKIEEKGFANNSSSIINSLHRLLIVFSNQGELTSADFLEGGKYANAIVLVNKKDVSTMINKIITIMTEIENDSEQFNIRIGSIKSCIENLFSNKKVADDHIKIYKNVLQ